MKPHPPITIETHDTNSHRMAFSASWRTEEHRFHVWLNARGEPQDGAETAIHRNLLAARHRPDDHRSLRGDSKAGRATFAAIAAEVAAGALAKAAEAQAAAIHAKIEASKALAREQSQKAMDRLWSEGFRPSVPEGAPHWDAMLTALDARMKMQRATGPARDGAALEYTIGYEQALIDTQLRANISPMPFLISCRGYGEVTEFLAKKVVAETIDD